MRLRGRGSERGASAVEFAIIASLLFMILFGTIQFGIAYNRYQGLQAAAREGARLASVDATVTDIINRVEQSVSVIDTTVVDTPGLCITNGSSNGNPTIDNRLCIAIQYIDSSGTAHDVTNNGSNGTTPPCDQAFASNGANPQIEVVAKYKMPILIPFVGNNIKPVVTGDAIFRCEK